MTSASWPGTLSGPIRPANITARDPVIRSKPNIGLQAFRRRMSQAPWDGEVEFVFTATEMASFVSFFNGSLYGGPGRFTATWLSYLGFTHHWARFTSPYTADLMSDTFVYHVKAKLEIVDFGVISSNIPQPWTDPLYVSIPTYPPYNAAGSYAAVVLADTPWAYWKMNEAAGATTALDATGNSRTFAYQGSPINIACEQGMLWENGDRCRYLNAYAFGSQPPIFSPFGTGAKFSFECWLRIYPSSQTDTNQFKIFLLQDSAHLSVNIGVNFSTGAAYASFENYTGLYTGVTVTATGSSNVVAKDVPTHIVGTIDTSADGLARIYVNGNLEGISPTGLTSIAPPTISNFIYGDGTFDYLFIGHVAIYGYALSAAKVLAHYNAGKHP